MLPAAAWLSEQPLKKEICLQKQSFTMKDPAADP